MTKKVHSSVEPIFNLIPVRVDILDINLNIIQKYYLLGDQPESIKTIISKEGIESKKNKFTFEENIQIAGGDIDWEDLNDEDFETIINTEPKEIINDIIPNNVSVKVVQAKDHIDYNINIFKEDHIIELQKKIAIITKIEPSKQYLSINGRCLTHYINFQYGIDSSYTDNVDLINFLKNCTTKIKDIPIDEEYISMKYNSSIINTQHNKLSCFIENIPNECLVIKLISLDTVISQKNIMQFLLRSDRQSFELIFESVIERFFIMMTSQIFTDYLDTDSLDFDFNYYKTIINNQTKLISELNKIPKVSLDDKNITVVTNAISLRSKGNSTLIVMLTKLFNNLILLNMENIFYVDLFITSNNKLLQIRKVSKYASQSINLIEGISMNIKPLVSSIREYKWKNRLILTLLPTNKFSKLIISIDPFGQVEVNAYSNRSTELTKKIFISEIITYIEPIIKYLNEISSAYPTPLRLDSNLQNYLLHKSTSNLIFNKKLDYDNLIKNMMTSLVSTGILDVEINNSEHIKNRIFKIYGKDTDSDKIIQVYANSKLAVFNLIDLTIDETTFYIDLLGRFVEYKSSDIVIKVSSDNNIQASDPVLYRYKSTKKNNYSRICQKRFQPKLATSSTPNAFKYHNFTFNLPQYYVCPTKENPHLGLLTGHHPNGYCLPCCRKLEQSDKNKLLPKCITGETLDDDLYKTSRTTNKYYIIDYPNDFISNNKMIDRILNVPDFINKMITKGNKLLVNGSSIDYNESTFNMQTLSIIAKYLGKKSNRLLVLDILEFLKDKSNHRKVLSMNNINFSFDSIEELRDNLSHTFIKQNIIKKKYLQVNWNELIIDILICMNVGIILFSDNRIRASDCEHIKNKSEECSNEIITSLNTSIKLLKLEYVNLDKPVLLLLRRVDSEYSKNHNNRRYFYFPIMEGPETDPRIEPLNLESIIQLKKIKNITQQSITNNIEHSFTYKTLSECINKIGKIKTLYTDSNNHIAYADITINPSKTLLLSLYRSPIEENNPLISKTLFTILDNKLPKYSGTIDDIFKLIEAHNKLQTNNLTSKDISDFALYIKINSNILLDHKPFSLPDSKKYLLKIDKFIIHSNTIIGTKLCAISKKNIIHTLIVYHKHISISDILKLLSTKSNEIKSIYKKSNLINKDIETIITTGLDFINRSTSIIFTNKIPNEFKFYFIEYQINPITLINSNPSSINYPSNNTLKKAQYMNNIYKIMINIIIDYWKTIRPIQLLKEIELFINETKLDVLKAMSNNLIEDWIDKLSTKFINKYHINIIRTKMYEFAAYAQTNIRVKTKESFIKALDNPDMPINNIEIYNLNYASKEQIKQLLEDTGRKCLVETNSIPEIAPKDIDNIYNQYKDKNGKLLILKSIYSELIDLAISDLSNPFRREFVLDNCMINSFVNMIKINSHINELIYMQEL